MVDGYAGLARMKQGLADVCTHDEDSSTTQMEMTAVGGVATYYKVTKRLFCRNELQYTT
jgi:hypothetical protein